MNGTTGFGRRLLRAGLGAATLAVMALADSSSAQEVTVALSGSQTIPPVTTSASGTGTLTVGPDRSISGKASISGMVVTVAHIHEAPAGANGPIIVPLTKVADNVWAVPAGAKLTEAQFEAFRAGRLYFNIHSEAHKGGEIRGQIKP
jgi:hypothetical protein